MSSSSNAPPLAGDARSDREGENLGGVVDVDRGRDGMDEVMIDGEGCGGLGLVALRLRMGHRVSIKGRILGKAMEGKKGKGHQ